MRIQHLIVGTCGLTLMTAGSVSAQADRATAVAETNRPGAQATVADPLAAGTNVLGPGIVVSITSADKVATGTLGTKLGKTSDGEFNPWLRVSGQLDQSGTKPPVTLADLRGLRDATTLAAGLNLVRWRWFADAQGTRALCREVFAAPETAPDSITRAIERAVAAAPDSLKRQVRDSVISYVVDHRCARHRLPAAAQQLFDELFDYGHIWLAGVSAEYGRHDYAYADTPAVAYRVQTQTAWAANLGGGVYLPAPRMLFAAMLRYEHAFDAGTPRQYCIPVGTTTALQCRTEPLGPPVRHDVSLLTLESRWFVNTRVGLSPRVTYDLSGNRGLGLELPILVRQATDKGFTSAVTVGWRSKPSSSGLSDRLYVSLTLGVTYGVGLGL